MLAKYLFRWKITFPLIKFHTIFLHILRMFGWHICFIEQSPRVVHENYIVFFFSLFPLLFSLWLLLAGYFTNIRKRYSFNRREIEKKSEKNSELIHSQTFENGNSCLFYHRQSQSTNRWPSMVTINWLYSLLRKIM